MLQLKNVDQLPKKEDIQDVPLEDPLKVFKICQQMEVVCEKEKGIGLSAIQVGIPWRLFIVKSETCPFIKKGHYGYFANTTYKHIGDESILSLEGCLSIKSEIGQLRFFQVSRYKDIKLSGYRLNFDKFLHFEKFDLDISFNEQGIVFQHEADHSIPVLISEIGKEILIW